MAEKKATEKKVAAKKTATKTTATKTTTKRCATKKAEVVVNVDAESVGFRAGDVYQTLVDCQNEVYRDIHFPNAMREGDDDE